MLCYPAGQIQPYAGTGTSVPRWAERTEFVSVQSVRPCDRKPELLVASGALRALRWGGGRAWPEPHAALPLRGLPKEGDPPVSEE